MEAQRSAVTEFLEPIGLAVKYGEVFAKNDIDMETLVELTQDDLDELGLSLGAQLRILRALEQRAAAPSTPHQVTNADTRYFFLVEIPIPPTSSAASQGPSYVSFLNCAQRFLC